MPKTKEEIYFGRTTKIVYHSNEDNLCVRLVNPQKLKNISAIELCNRLRAHLGKIEFEQWFAFQLLGSAIQACAKHASYVDLDWLDSDLYAYFMDDPEWTLLIDSSTLKSALRSFDIFEVLEDEKGRLVLKYVD